MYIENTETGDRHDVVIEPVEKADYTTITKSKMFQFKWNKCKGKEVYKLRMVATNEILGLMHVVNHPEKGHEYLEIKLLESSKDNIGQGKKYNRIAGCLLAFASKLSIAKGNDGFVMLISKTKIAEHYNKKYGYEYNPIQPTLACAMNSDYTNSKKLIREYRIGCYLLSN